MCKIGPFSIVNDETTVIPLSYLLNWVPYMFYDIQQNQDFFLGHIYAQMEKIPNPPILHGSSFFTEWQLYILHLVVMAPEDVLLTLACKSTKYQCAYKHT